MPTPPDALLRLAALNLLTDPYVEAQSLIEELQGFGVMQFTLHAGKTITRGRPNEMQDGQALSFSQASELSYKPQRFNNNYQRASTPRQTMFYGSVLPEHLLPSEVQAERIISVSESSTLLRNAHQPAANLIPPPEVITFGRWVVIDNIPLVAYATTPRCWNATHLGGSCTRSLSRVAKRCPNRCAATRVRRISFSPSNLQSLLTYSAATKSICFQPFLPSGWSSKAWQAYTSLVLRLKAWASTLPFLLTMLTVACA